MAQMSVLEATAQIVTSAVSQRQQYPDANYGKSVAEFAETIYNCLAKLEFSIEPDEDQE